MITVVYPPGASDPIHRHNAHAFLYVLEGSVVMQVNGGNQTVPTVHFPNGAALTNPSIDQVKAQLAAA